jgi:hypothetical protein
LQRDGRSLALAEEQTTKRSEIVQRAPAGRQVLIELRQLEIDDAQRVQPAAVGDGDILDNRGLDLTDLLSEQRDVFVSALQRVEWTFHGSHSCEIPVPADLKSASRALGPPLTAYFRSWEAASPVHQPGDGIT